VTLDIAICTRDRPDDLRRCLAAVARQTAPPRRILVVNGGAPLSALDSPAEVFESAPGLPRQRNLALDRLDAELVAFLDDDVELDADYLEHVLRWFAEHPTTVGVSGHIKNDLPFSAASRYYRRLFSLSSGDGILQPSGEVIYLYHPARPTRVDALSGSNMIWRRSAVESLRFDEALEGYAYMEDVDFSLRAGLRGELWMLPDARLLHHKTQAARVPARAYVRQVIENGAYLYGKHGREYPLRRTAYARRVVGRSTAYVAVAARSRSLEPLLGLAEGVAAVPAALRRGRLASGDARASH
jgi:GT2 family glycosyltransferase